MAENSSVYLFSKTFLLIPCLIMVVSGYSLLLAWTTSRRQAGKASWLPSSGKIQAVAFPAYPQSTLEALLDPPPILKALLPKDDLLHEGRAAIHWQLFRVTLALSVHPALFAVALCVCVYTTKGTHLYNLMLAPKHYCHSCNSWMDTNDR